jgi:hypothetical protein
MAASFRSSARERRLTKTAYADFGANWAPDVNRIAFLSILPHQQGAAVCVVDVQAEKHARNLGPSRSSTAYRMVRRS